MNMALDPANLEYPLRRYGMDHDRYAWSMLTDRPAMEWPEGKKLALWVNVSLQHFPMNPAGKPVKLPGSMTMPYPDLRHYTLRDYGNRVGIYRFLDAFAKHGECLERDAQGACLRGQNAVQILADAMTVLHRHWPSARSSTFGRSFQDSYGAAVSADSANGYEPLLAAVLPGDLLPATSALSPVLLNLSVIAAAWALFLQAESQTRGDASKATLNATARARASRAQARGAVSRRSAAAADAREGGVGAANAGRSFRAELNLRGGFGGRRPPDGEVGG